MCLSKTGLIMLRLVFFLWLIVDFATLVCYYKTKWNGVFGGIEMDNEEVKYYQPLFRRWIDSDKWDAISEKLSGTDISTIGRVMSATKDGDCSWVVWRNCDYVLERIRTIAKKIK